MNCPIKFNSDKVDSVKRNKYVDQLHRIYNDTEPIYVGTYYGSLYPSRSLSRFYL